MTHLDSTVEDEGVDEGDVVGTTRLKRCNVRELQPLV